MVFRVFGIRISLDFSFFLLIAFALALHFENVLYMVLFSSLHEAGHLLVLYLLRGKAQEIHVSYYGIGLKQQNAFSASGEILFLLAGPLVNLVFFACGVYRQLNFALMFINLLPIFPLDGGRILRCVLSRCFSLRVSDALLKGISAVLCLLFISAGIYLKNISLILISLYTIFYCVNLSRYV